MAAAALESLQARRTQFLDFLEHNFAGRTYGALARELGSNGRWRLLVNLDDVRTYSPAYAEQLLSSPSAILGAMEEALRVYVGQRDELRLRVGFTGSFGAHHVSPRALGAELLGKLVLVEGIVTKVASVKPRLIRSVHYCEETKERIVRTYVRPGGLSAGGDDEAAAAVPTHDAQGRPLQFEFGLSQFVDVQKVVVQEMPERAPPGQLPRSVQVTLEHDIVDSLKPGDRVRICGHYRALLGDQERDGAHGNSALFRVQLVANSVQSVQRALSAEDAALSADDLRAIKQAAQDPRIVPRLARSLAPSIFGHTFVKQALLLQLLGGCERVLENGTHLRGDVNVLLVGDPSTAKSQLLRFILHVAPLAVSTSGRGSSGVGLTAAVTTDEETGERRLEAGAMVLADRGTVCIDEFDKMSVEDRVAIHEVMEQQTVTIAKAGIHASLNARCSVLAAANPIYGKYDRRRKPADNIALPDSLLSRFDLLFIVLDTLDAEHDRHIARHVLRMHRNAPSKAAASNSVNSGGSGIFARYGDEEEWERDSSLLDPDSLAPRYSLAFLKKYILYARYSVQPMLSTEASRAIVDAFEELRTRTTEQRTMPVTPRSLETLIRLSTAHAKARLSHEVTLEDTREALRLVTHALYQDTVTSTSTTSTNSQPLTDPKTQTAATAQTNDPVVITPPMKPSSESLSEQSSEAEKLLFKSHLAETFKEAREEVQLPRSAVTTRINELRAASGARALTSDEFTLFFEILVDEGRLTYVDSENVYL